MSPDRAVDMGARTAEESLHWIRPRSLATLGMRETVPRDRPIRGGEKGHTRKEARQAGIQPATTAAAAALRVSDLQGTHPPKAARAVLLSAVLCRSRGGVQVLW